MTEHQSFNRENGYDESFHSMNGKPLLHELGLGLQHVVFSITTIMSVPLVFAAVLGLSITDRMGIVQMSLLVSGLITILQSTKRLRPWGIGAGSPAILGPDATILGIAFKSISAVGLAGFYGIMLIGGIMSWLIGMSVRLWYKRISKAVVASVLLTFSVAALPVCLDLFLGGIGTPEYGSLRNIMVGASVLAFAMFIYHNGYGFIRNAAISLGILFGLAICISLGMIDFSQMMESNVLATPKIMPYKPSINLQTLILIFPGLLVLIIKQIADLLVAGEWLTNDEGEREAILAAGMKGNAIGYMMTVIFGSLPTSYLPANLGLSILINDQRRRSTAIAGGILCLLSITPIFANFIALIPSPIIGAVSLMALTSLLGLAFNMIRTMEWHSKNWMILCFSFLIGLVGILNNGTVSVLPDSLQILFESGLTTSLLVGLSLQLVLPNP